MTDPSQPHHMSTPRICPSCNNYLFDDEAPKCVCANNLVPAPAKAVFASTDWVGALATRWERRLTEPGIPGADSEDVGWKAATRKCLDELRAEMESAPTDW
jgi:hypothetical protein